MQFASSGFRVFRRRHRGAFWEHATHRSIHIPPCARQIPNAATIQRVVARVRNYLGQYVAHLTGPGLKSPNNPFLISRCIHEEVVPGRITTIQQRLSFVVRTSLKRSFRDHYFPRPPALGPPCSVTSLGLGLVRNFSSGRSVFQNFVHSTTLPVGCSADVVVDSKHRKSRPIRKSKRNIWLEVPGRSQASTPASEDMETYFRLSPPTMTTRLLIPLSPNYTPSDPETRVAEQPSLLPRAQLWNIHQSHDLHALKVSSLLSRLDSGDVWVRGARGAAWGDENGNPRMLEVEFTGWTMEDVRRVIGDGGQDWCVLE